MLVILLLFYLEQYKKVHVLFLDKVFYTPEEIKRFIKANMLQNHAYFGCLV